MLELLFAALVIVVRDQAHKGVIIGEFDNGVAGVNGKAVVSEEGAWGVPCIHNVIVFHLDILGSVAEEALYPGAQFRQ